MKEFIQNADDAKATKMYVILDSREHGTDRVLSEDWKELQGPALLVWNDKDFTDEDLKGIQELGVGSKRDDDGSIGQFGIGFNVVYNVTDCPSFITQGNILCIFDPHCRYVPGADHTKPGRQYTLDQSFWSNMSDLRTAYLLDDVPNKPLGLESGVLFRFPLRCTDKLVNDSELVDSETQVLTADKVKKLLHEWIFLIKDSLLFLNNLTQFEVFAIDDKQKGFEKLFSFSVCLTNEDQKQRSNVIEKYKNSKVCSKVVYQLTLKTNELEEHWLILQGVGNLKIPEKQWIFPKSIPKHGIAAPLSKQEHFNGKVFCFLPLPEDTDLPVHINGQFILSSDRRSIWHCSSDDDSDNKAKWNSDLIKAIAYSYALFLCDAKGYYINSKGYQNLAKFYDAINCYYDLFPFWNPPFNSLPEQQSVSSSDVEIQSEHKLKNNWHNINEMVFEFLWSNNSPILASKVRISKSQKVTWHVLKELDLHDQAYFDSQNMTNEALSTHDELKLVLRDIGMTLTCAPDTLYMHLKKFKPEPAIINRESVFKYYRMFYHLKINKCPCPLNTTPFKSVKNFCLFYKFLLAMDTSDQNNIHYIFPDSPVDLPLLLTNDLQLRMFTKFAIKSNFCHLFKNTSDKFLHSSVLAVCPQVSSSYFFTKDDTSIKGTVVEIMKNNYKALCCEKFIYSNHEDINGELLKVLWKCLHKDPIFHCYEKAIVQSCALIPADKQILFRNSSPILPVINPLEQKQLCESEESEQYKKYYEMFVSMGIPSFNSSVSEYALKYCLDLSKHFIRVLSTVCHLNHQQNLHLYLPGLFDYFGKIDFRHNSKSVQQIKSLPLFKTLHDKWTKIDKKALYTMSSELCDAGFEKWAPFDKVVILKERGDWRMLCDKIETLGGERLSERNIYLKLIFPKFSELSKDEQKLHLKFIRDKVYPHVKADIDHGHDGGRYVNAALLFKRQLEDLKCIESKDGNLKTIKSYCHHEIKIFSLFQENEEFELIPEEYQDQEDGWMDFLCDLGLQKKIELSQFKKYCHDVSLGVLSNINNVSEALVEYLFSESAEEWHDNSEILSEIGNICFVQVQSLDELQMIADSCKVENGLTSLKGSVIGKWAEIIWTVKPVVSLPIDETHELYNKILENLSVIIKPSVNDVYENITKISKTDLAEFGHFSKYEMSRGCILPSVESVIKKSLQYMFEEGENDLLEKLSNVPCIPVSAVHKSDNYPVLVKPLQVVRYIPDECKCLFPYIHNLPSFMNTIDGDLKLLGISDNITVKMLKTMLQFIYEKNKDLRDPNISIQVRTAILKIEELFSASNNAVSSDIAPLYLPNDQHKLVDSSQLVYIDAHRYRVNLEVMRFHGLLFQLPPAILNSSSVTTSNAYCSDEQRVCLQLPKCIRPNGLSFVCTEEVLQVNECESSRCQFFSHLQNFKCLVPFLKEELLKNKGFGNEYDDKLLFLVDFIMEMELKVVSFLECNVRIDEEIVGIIQVQYSLQHLRCKQCVLYIESNASLSPFMREMLAHTLCVEAIRRHHIQDEICLSKYVELVCQFLQIQVREDINTIFGNTINVRRDHIPKPGAQIPNELLDVLIQGNDSHIFNEGEWVGYLIESVFVFATVVGPIIDELGNVIKYKIHINESEQEVSVSDIYKFEFGDNSVLTQPVPTPPNPEEAKRWFRQAKSDETVMNILLERAQENSECWCHVLFLAQQVCEKALKAGMYKLVGLDDYDLRTHKLDFYANTLTATCELTWDQLCNKVFYFKNYYISSRYPNAHSLPNAPVDVYSIDQRTCRRAASHASEVLHLIGMLSNLTEEM
jgi:sacsin